MVMFHQTLVCGKGAPHEYKGEINSEAFRNISQSYIFNLIHMAAVLYNLSVAKCPQWHYAPFSSPASSAEVKTWSSTSTPPICLLCAQRQNLKRTNNITMPSRRQIQDITKIS